MTSKLYRLSIAVLALAPSLALAVVPMPETRTFSARIADNGRPVTGTHDFVFRFWSCPAQNTTNCKIEDTSVSPVAMNQVLWKEAQSLTVNDGVVTAVLGADDTTAPPNTFPVTLFNGSDLWFSVTMDGTDFGPFMAVRGVPYLDCRNVTQTASVAVNGINSASVACPTGYTAVSANYTTGSGSLLPVSVLAPSWITIFSTRLWLNNCFVQMKDIGATGGSFEMNCRCCRLP